MKPDIIRIRREVKGVVVKPQSVDMESKEIGNVLKQIKAVLK